MPAPSQLAIATSVVQRLIKEEASYHKELEKQQAHVQKLESNPGDDENAEYTLKQEKRAMDETRAVFPGLRQRIQDAVAKLSDQVEREEEAGTEDEEVKRAKEVLMEAKKAVTEIDDVKG